MINCLYFASIQISLLVFSIYLITYLIFKLINLLHFWQIQLIVFVIIFVVYFLPELSVKIFCNFMTIYVYLFLIVLDFKLFTV